MASRLSRHPRPLHRKSSIIAAAGQKVLRIELAAHAEAAADVDLHQLHGGLREAEHARQRAAVEERHLGGAPHGELGRGALPLGDQAARLERHRGVPVTAERLDSRVVRRREAQWGRRATPCSAWRRSSRRRRESPPRRRARDARRSRPEGCRTRAPRAPPRLRRRSGPRRSRRPPAHRRSARRRPRWAAAGSDRSPAGAPGESESAPLRGAPPRGDIETTGGAGPSVRWRSVRSHQRARTAWRRRAR